MPDSTYAIVAGLGMAQLGIALLLWMMRGPVTRGVPETRRRHAKHSLLAGAWTLVALVLVVWSFRSCGVVAPLYPIFGAAYVPLGLSLAWVLLGMIVAVRLRRAMRAMRFASIKAAGLNAPLPQEAEDLVARQGVKKEDIVATLAPDVGTDGAYAEHRIVVARDRLLALWLPDGRGRLQSSRAAVEKGARGPEVTHELPFEDLAEIRAESVVGGGRLVVRRKGRAGPPEVVARYTNSHGETFSGLAKKLSDHLAKLESARSSRVHDVVPTTRRSRVHDVVPTTRKEGEEVPDFDIAALKEAQPASCPSCGRPLGKDTKVCPNCVKRGRVSLRLLAMAKPYWKSIVALGLLMVLGSGLGLVSPYLWRTLLDEVLDAEVASGQRTGSFFGLYHGPSATLLKLLVWALVGFQVTAMAINAVRGWVGVYLGARIGMELRARVFHHLQTLSLGYFDRQKTGVLMARTDHDTGRVQHFLSDGVQFVIVNMLQVIGIAVILFAMSWKLALWVMLPAPLVVISSGFFWRFIIGMFRRLWERVGRLSAFLNDSISGVRVVKAFGQEEREKGRFDEYNVAVYEGLLRAERTWIIFHPVLHLIIGAGGIIVWYAGGLGVVHEEMSLGTFVAFHMYLMMFYGPLRMITQLNQWLTRSLTSAERVFEVLDVEPEVKDAEKPVPVEVLEGRVELEAVTFGYEKFKPVLKDVSFVVEPGEMLGLVGHSGAGKSTAINLVCRLYDVDEGELRIDGKDIRKLSLADLRRQIGVVLQETYLFSGRVAENIAYARPEAAREEILEAAAAANAHDFIMRMPDGYDSEVGERGKKLSVGEKQRVSIARAILHNPKILILDEATSSVDTQTEQQIQAALARLVKNRTTIAIAHRLSTLRNAHRLVVLDHGEVKEIGTHDELTAKRGMYQKLVKAQTEMSRLMAVGG